MVTNAVPGVELAKVELTLMICSVEAVTELGGEY